MIQMQVYSVEHAAYAGEVLVVLLCVIVDGSLRDVLPERRVRRKPEAGLGGVALLRMSIGSLYYCAHSAHDANKVPGAVVVEPRFRRRRFAARYARKMMVGCAHRACVIRQLN